MGARTMHWVSAITLGSIGVYIIGLNYRGLYLGLFRGESHSPVLLIGGVAGSIALAVCPTPSLRGWAWLPLVLDPGCAFALLALIYAVITKKSF